MEQRIVLDSVDLLLAMAIRRIPGVTQTSYIEWNVETVNLFP